MMEQTLNSPQPLKPKTRNGRTQVIIATSVMLSFISFWRAAAIVLNDLVRLLITLVGLPRRRSVVRHHGSFSA